MDLQELGALTDRLESVRQQRLAADRVAADLKSEENKLKAVLIAEMEQNDLSSVGGKVTVINRSVKERAIATDWPQIYGFITEFDAFDLLHKRLTDSAVLLRRDDKVHVPSTSILEYSHITYAKART